MITRCAVQVDMDIVLLLLLFFLLLLLFVFICFYGTDMFRDKNVLENFSFCLF